MNPKTEYGPIHPSILTKIQLKPSLFLENFHETQPSFTKTYAPAFASMGLRSHSRFAPSCNSPILVGAPSERRSSWNTNVEVLSYRFIIIMGTAPFERIKLLIQSQNEMIRAGRLSSPYKGIFDCFARTVRSEGVISLWRGNFSYALKDISSGLLHSVFRHYYWSMANQRMKNKESSTPLKRIAWLMAADVISCGTQVLLLYPLQYAQTRLANDIQAQGKVSERQFNGLTDILRKTIKTDGVSGLYLGLNISIVKSYLSNWIVGGTYPYFKSFWLALSQAPQSFQVPFVAALSVGNRLLAELILYPVDTVARRMMMRSGEAVKYKNSLDAFLQIRKAEGFRSLYKGAEALMLKSACKFCLVSFTVLAALNRKMNRQVDGGVPDSSFSIRWSNARSGSRREGEE